jgi:RNA polymerase sigma factor (TIGR02999 family)
VNGSIGALVTAAQRGDALAARALFDALYEELHRMARRELARRGGAAEISPTTLLHQAYIDMAGSADRAFPDRARFMGYAARVMRGLLIDHAREQRAHKRGGQFHITSLPTDVAEQLADVQELTGISDALDELAKIDHEAAEIVDLKFFCGFSFAEIAAMYDVSERTVQRRWEKARLYLYRSLRATLS